MHCEQEGFTPSMQVGCSIWKLIPGIRRSVCCKWEQTYGHVGREDAGISQQNKMEGDFFNLTPVTNALYRAGVATALPA